LIWSFPGSWRSQLQSYQLLGPSFDIVTKCFPSAREHARTETPL